jgi:DNA-binding NarL/FixJ family response regulator
LLEKVGRIDYALGIEGRGGNVSNTCAGIVAFWSPRNRRTVMSVTGEQKERRGKRRVFIVDDHPAVQQGLGAVIGQQRDLEICGAAGTAREAMPAIAESKPDIVIVDLSLQEGSGLELIKDLRARHHKLGLLVLSMHDEMLYAERALHAGASGYVMKKEPMNVLLAAMRQVLEGGVYLSDRLKARIVGTYVGRTEPALYSPVQVLSDRELEVFELIGQGFGTQEIAHQLNLSMKTVSCYRQNIKSKLGLKGGPELVRHAIHWAEARASA